MRELTDHKINDCNTALRITALDAPGPGGAHHVYQITGYTPQTDAGKEAWETYRAFVGAKTFSGDPMPTWEEMMTSPFEQRLKIAKAWSAAAAAVPIRFQNGPIKEVGTNGVTHEALLAIVRDRLRAFQSGPYACRENAIALTKLDEAAMWLAERTRSRAARGVEGTSAK